MPFKEGNTVAGWGVVRNAPWDFAGIFKSKDEAEAKAADMGEEYDVHYGENQEGTDNFIWTGED